MPPHPTAAHSDGHCRLYRTRAVSAESNCQFTRAVRIARRRSTNLWLSLHTVHHRAGLRPHDPPQTLAPQISMLHVVAEGARS
jgi:hypothetical protein